MGTSRAIENLERTVERLEQQAERIAASSKEAKERFKHIVLLRDDEITAWLQQVDEATGDTERERKALQEMADLLRKRLATKVGL